MIKCVVVILSIATGDIKEVAFHAPDCEAVYQMVERKAQQKQYEVLGVYSDD